jgi:excisionase family DNA binding protein
MPERTENKEVRTILTVREVAEYLRMSETKVYRLAKERQLPVIRIGRTWRFRKDLLDDWLSKCTESNMVDQVATSLSIKHSVIDQGDL